MERIQQRIASLKAKIHSVLVAVPSRTGQAHPPPCLKFGTPTGAKPAAMIAVIRGYIKGVLDSVPELAVAARTHRALELDDAAQTHGASELEEGPRRTQRGTVATSEPTRTRTRRPKKLDVAARTQLDEGARRTQRGTVATSEPTRTRRPKKLDVAARPHRALELDDAAQTHGASELEEAGTRRTKRGANTAIATSEATQRPEDFKLDFDPALVVAPWRKKCDVCGQEAFLACQQCDRGMLCS